MPTSKVYFARSVVPAAKASKSTKTSATKPAAANAKTSNSSGVGKGLPRKAGPKAAKHPSRNAHGKPAATKPKGAVAKPVLLAGGNPQIARGDGDAPVQAYIAAMPGWKSDVGRRLDALIVRSVPSVRKAVRWNSPFYGVEGQGWFLDFHCFTRYVKVAFFRGTSLRPTPPGESRHKEVRYLDIHEYDQLNEERLTSWIRQAASIPGWNGGSAL